MCVNPCSHLYANAEWGMRKWEINVDVDVQLKCCEQYSFVWRTFGAQPNAIHCYPFGIGTSKKNTFTILGAYLIRQTPNKPLFGIRLGSLQSRMPRSHTDVDIRSQLLFIEDGTQRSKSTHASQTAKSEQMLKNFQKRGFFVIICKPVDLAPLTWKMW